MKPTLEHFVISKSIMGVYREHMHGIPDLLASRSSLARQEAIEFRVACALTMQHEATRALREFILALGAVQRLR